MNPDQIVIAEAISVLASMMRGHGRCGCEDCQAGRDWLEEHGHIARVDGVLPMVPTAKGEEFWQELLTTAQVMT